MRRLGGVLVTLVLLAAGAFALLQVVAARDDSEIATPVTGGPGAPHEGECTDSDAVIPRDGGRLTDDQILHALELGNVVLLAPDPKELEPIQREVSGRYDPELAAAGQMVILGRGGAEAGATALAFDRTLDVASPTDPELREFAETWLGNTAGRTCD